MTVTVILSLSVGRYPLHAAELLRYLAAGDSGPTTDPCLSTAITVLRDIRVPRVLLSLAVGTALAVSGAVFQGLFRNPLVSPDILGVSAGASFGAALAIVAGSAGRPPFSIELSSFCFGLLAVLLAYSIGKKAGEHSPTVMVLAGVVVSSVFTAALSFLKYVADPYEELPAIVFWTMGGLYTAGWQHVVRTIPLVVVGTVAVYLLRWKLNLMAMGDEEALSLGLDVQRYRACFVTCATLIVTASVSATGTIGWVGLVVPHLGRMLVGPDHRVLIPFVTMIGAAFLTVTDTVARSVAAAEIPIGIVTSFVGAPFLGYLLLMRKSGWWGERGN